MRSREALAEIETQFWVFIRKGWTNTAACEAVGVDRTYGYRWRMATGGRIPRSAPPVSGRYLSLDERLRIADLRLSGEGVRAIGALLGRSPGTISRELARNCPARTRKGPGKYAPYAAQKQAEIRGRRPKRSKFDNVELAQFVEGKLLVRWSPEQISDGLADRYPANSVGQPCTLVSSTEAAKFLGGTVTKLGGDGSCVYSLPIIGTAGSSGPTPSIEVVTSTKPNTVRTVKTLLDPRKIQVAQHVPKGAPALNLSRHFVTVDGRRTVYTIQGDPTVVVSKSGDLLPQANIATLVGGSAVQIIVTGTAQPQKIAKIAMGDALSHS